MAVCLLGPNSLYLEKLNHISPPTLFGTKFP